MAKNTVKMISIFAVFPLHQSYAISPPTSLATFQKLWNPSDRGESLFGLCHLSLTKNYVHSRKKNWKKKKEMKIFESEITWHSPTFLKRWSIDCCNFAIMEPLQWYCNLQGLSFQEKKRTFFVKMVEKSQTFTVFSIKLEF